MSAVLVQLEGQGDGGGGLHGTSFEVPDVALRADGGGTTGAFFARVIPGGMGARVWWRMAGAEALFAGAAI